MNTTALITGASEGIGFELAELFAKDHTNLILVARNEQKLAGMKVQYEQAYGINVSVIAQDLSAPGAPEVIYRKLQEANLSVDILVNNAGFGDFGLFHESDLKKQMEMLQVNITALTALTHRLTQHMVAARRGQVLNVASTAAFQPGPLMSVYYATKAYVLSFSEAIANELADYGVTVSVLCPGPTKTNFTGRANMEASKLFKGSVMDARRVAREAYEGLKQGKTIIIPGGSNRFLAMGVRFLPRKFVANVARKMQEPN